MVARSATAVENLVTPARRPMILACIALALAAVLLADPTPVLTLWRDRLEHWEALPKKTDAVFILLGDVVPRAMYAAALAREDRSPVIAMARPATNAAIELGLYPSEDDVACAMLRRLGVPDSSVVVLPGPVESTYDEAQAARSWAMEHGVRQILFVTSSYHSARARWILQRILTPQGIAVHVAAVPAPEVDFAPWWLSEDGLVTVFNETVKSLFYRVKYWKSRA